MNGPSVPLSPTVIQPLAMVLHEFAANAAKHGALSRLDGGVEITWRTGHRSGEDGMLHIRWAEHGGPPVPDAPPQRGLGTRMMTIEGQLGGLVEWHRQATGLIYEIRLPLARPGELEGRRGRDEGDWRGVAGRLREWGHPTRDTHARSSQVPDPGTCGRSPPPLTCASQHGGAFAAMLSFLDVSSLNSAALYRAPSSF